MFTCYGLNNGHSGPHQHEFASQSKPCYLDPPKPPPFTFGSKATPSGPLSVWQHKYALDLGGDDSYLKTLTYAECSRWISDKVAARNSKPSVSEPAPARVYRTPSIPTAANTPALAMVETLFASIPDGYYAVGDDPNRFESLTFIRFSRPKRGRFTGSLKFQRHVGTGMGYRHDDYCVRWPSGGWSFYDRRGQDFVIDTLLKICADTQGAAMTYAEHLKRCCRCNADLTDERSRYYGIGPECEKEWPWVIERVDGTKGVFV